MNKKVAVPASQRRGNAVRGDVIRSEMSKVTGISELARLSDRGL
jgi:hypothetical protein